VAAGHPAAQRTALADEVLLADELVKAPGPHPGGEGLSLRRRPEKGLGSRSGRTTGRHLVAVYAGPRARP
jgi:hypothetical protein